MIYTGPHQMVGRDGNMRPAHEWEERWINERLNGELINDSDTHAWFFKYRGRFVTGPDGEGRFWLVPRNSMVGLTSSRPMYVLALPGELTEWSFPPTPKVAL